MRKIFISSTFRDMQAERDAIHMTIVPQLRKMAQQYGEDVEVCDLRWGVNTGDLESGDGAKKVLSVCLDEIDKCKPFMLVMLGDRYGWVPETSDLQNAAERKDFDLDDPEKSVTALEIEYGALQNPEVLQRSLFLFRDPIEGAGAEYQSEGEAYRAKLERLKDHIRKQAGDRVFSYRLGWDSTLQAPTGLEQFSELVTEQLRCLLEQEWQEYRKLHENQREEKRHWSVVTAKAEQFAGRDELLALCRDTLEHKKGKLALFGAGGSGKSTLWSRLVSDYHAQGWNVYPFICGNTEHSAGALDILKQWIFYVETLLDVPHFTEDKNTTVEKWRMRLIDLLVKYNRKNNTPPLLLAADGLDQLEQSELSISFGFLPIFREPKVHFLVSCLDEYDMTHYKGDVIEVSSMTPPEQAGVLRGMLAYQGKDLGHDVTEAIFQKSGADNPLYLSLLVQRLAMMDKDDFDVIAAYGNDMQAINRYQTELIQNAPEGIEPMSRQLVCETARRINPGLVQRAAEYIALSRHGLRETDLMALLARENIAWSSLDFSRAIHYMPMLFAERENGQIDLSHRMVRAGLRRGLDETTMNRQILSHLQTLQVDDELRMNELLHYCYVLDEKKVFADYLTEVYDLEDEDIQEQYTWKLLEELHQLCAEDSGEWYLALLRGEDSCTEEVIMFAYEYVMSVAPHSNAELDTKQKFSAELLTIFRKLCEEDASDEYELLLCTTLLLSATNCMSLDRPEEAMAYGIEMLALARKLYEEDNDHLVTYSTALQIMQTVYALQDKLLETLDCAKEAFTVIQKQYEAHQKREYRTEYGNALIHMGVIEFQDKPEEALHYIEEGLTLLQKQTAWEQTYECYEAYRQGLLSVGTFYKDLQRPREALQYLEKARVSYQKSYEELRTLESQRAYSECLFSLGQLYWNQGNRAKAIAYCEDAYELATDLHEKLKTQESRRLKKDIREYLGQIKRMNVSADLISSTRLSSSGIPSNGVVIQVEEKKNKYHPLVPQRPRYKKLR